jgi:hypothetical protein
MARLLLLLLLLWLWRGVVREHRLSLRRLRNTLGRVHRGLGLHLTLSLSLRRRGRGCSRRKTREVGRVRLSRVNTVPRNAVDCHQLNTHLVGSRHNSAGSTELVERDVVVVANLDDCLRVAELVCDCTEVGAVEANEFGELVLLRDRPVRVGSRATGLGLDTRGQGGRRAVRVSGWSSRCVRVGGYNGLDGLAPLLPLDGRKKRSSVVHEVRDWVDEWRIPISRGGKGSRRTVGTRVRGVRGSDDNGNLSRRGWCLARLGRFERLHRHSRLRQRRTHSLGGLAEHVLAYSGRHARALLRLRVALAWQLGL